MDLEHNGIRVGKDKNGVFFEIKFFGDTWEKVYADEFFEEFIDSNDLFNLRLESQQYMDRKNQGLFDEIDDLIKAIKEKLFQNDDQRTLDRLWKNVNIVIDFMNIELTNKEYEYYLENKGTFTPVNFVSFINTRASRYGLPYDIAIPEGQLERVFERLINFYDIALKRDKILVDNMFKGMRGKKIDVAVLVTGGFHTKGITKFLQEKDASYVVISPSITDDVESPYIAVLTGQKTPFEDASIGTIIDIRMAPAHLSQPLVRMTDSQWVRITPDGKLDSNERYASEKMYASDLTNTPVLPHSASGWVEVVAGNGDVSASLAKWKQMKGIGA